MQEKELVESFWLCNIKGIGRASIKKLIQETKSAGGVWKLPDSRLNELLGTKRAERLKKGMEEKYRKTAERTFYRMREKKIFFLPCWDSDYPKRLKETADAPAFLYGKGKLFAQERKTAAVIGTRECSGYGREMAKYFAAGLARQGIVVVSGMARGVDGIAQEAALAAGGSSVAVLGCGVDICYPPESQRLYERLEAEGCLLSEYPPGTQPQACLFPPRNRIISGLSELVLVIEAREKSGTLITVDMALEQGRDVFAVPGRITDNCSRGCNRLIGNGAGAALGVAQLLEEIGMADRPKPGEQEGSRTDNGAASPESGSPQPSDGSARPLRSRVLEILDCEPKSLDEILDGMEEKGERAAVAELMQELVLLCMEKRAGSSAGMYFLESK